MTIMSLQSANGNQNIVMIPTSDDKIDVEPTSSSTLKSESIKSPRILMSKNISLKEEMEIENETDQELKNNDTEANEVIKSTVTIGETDEQLSNHDTSCTKMQPKKLPIHNWKIVHGRMLTNEHTNKNGDKRSCQKNITLPNKNLTTTLMTSNSSINVKSLDDNQQNFEYKLPELCASNTDCVACKETFLDKLELHKHTTIAHPDVPIKFCDLCNTTFFNEDELQNHKFMIHGESSKIAESHNDFGELLILNELDKEQQCSNEDVSKTTQSTSLLRNETDNQMDIDGEKIKPDTLKYVEEATIKPIISFPHAVKVEMAEGESDILSYTALTEKKDYEDCRKISETSLQECDWARGEQNNLSENNQDSMLINNDTHIENRMIPSTEEFQSIEELERPCEVDSLNHTEKAQPTHEINENGDFETNTNQTQLISDLSNISVIESMELADDRQTGELPSEELTEMSESDINAISLSSKTSSSLICRTYSSKTNSQISKKLSTKIDSIKKDDISFCIMCREIFSLIEQKSMKTNLEAESIFKCPLCSRQFESRSTLEKHVAYHHLNCECTKIRKCPTSICLDVSISRELYECVLCPALFDDYNGLSSHILTLHEPMPPFKDRLTIGKPEYLRSIRCSYMESKMSLRKNKNNSAKVSKINCSKCELTFMKCDDYILHVKDSHNNMIPIAENSLPSVKITQTIENSAAHTIDMDTSNTDINGSNIITLIQNVDNSNITKNSPELRKTCKRCNKEFQTVRELSEHFYFAHDDTLESQAIIASASTVDKRTHDWSCLHCSQRFKLLQSYIRHRYFVHNDESMVHICENCNKILTSVTMVNVHVCMNVSSWECKPCNESFENGMELRLHNTVKHPETLGPHICSICEKRFITMTMLKRHREAKNCYPCVRPPEKSNIIEQPLNNESYMKKSTTIVKKAKPLSQEKKVKKEYPRVQDLPHMRVIQEDVFVRDAKNKNSLHNKKNKNPNSSSTSPKSQQNDEIYQCSMCKLYFLSKAGLKIHLNRAHTSAVEICQLCYKMFVSGNLVRHITDNHLKHDNNNQSYFKAMQVKQHNTFHFEEHDIEKDTEELIAIIGTNHLLGLCEYQRFTEQSDDDRFCPDCPLTFDNSEKYRRHYVQTHDKLCALCNMEFETGQEAARHKTRIHGSMACYVWFAHKLIAAISDTKTFSEMAEKIIIDTISIETNETKMDTEECNEAKNYNNDVEMREAEENYISSDTFNGLSNSNEWEENDILKKNSLHEESNEMVHANNIKNELEFIDADDDEEDEDEDDGNDNDNDNDEDDDDDELDDYKIFILVTEDDLDRYKNNISGLAQQIYSTCNIFSINQIERMLEPYAKM